jgi:hypothetical protein
VGNERKVVLKQARKEERPFRQRKEERETAPVPERVKTWLLPTLTCTILWDIPSQLPRLGSVTSLCMPRSDKSPSIS